jgi:hypothetical protein
MRWGRGIVAASLLTLGGAAAAETVTAARFAAPTLRYAHGVLGDAEEWGALEITLSGTAGAARLLRITLPEDHVFEDIAPRLADVTGDGQAEVIVVETDLQRGAALAVYGAGGKIAETPHIGQAHRWLAPAGAADLDGDGRVEIAYVDRPHLARVLRLWRFEGGALVEIAALDGLTNHRIGDAYISGGIRDCGAVPEIVLASPDWRRLQAVQFDGQHVLARDVGPITGPNSFDEALACR